VASIALAAAVIELVRRRRLREEFSWLWVLGSGGALVLSIWEGGRDGLGRLMGTNPETAVLTTGLVFLVLVALDISTKLSRIANQQKNLAQGHTRLDKRLVDLETEDGD
jgi:hypothetical protein